MPDHAVSSDPRVQAQLDRLSMLSPGADVLGLERISTLMDRLGNPETRLPPVFHVAGTNGKGSVCAYLRAAMEAAGYKAHVFTSPHLVRFNERIRVAGRLIEDDLLADLLAEVLDVGQDVGASFFEVTTAVAFLAFTRTPADVCVIEVGLGGRLDATNVLPAPVACGIAQLGIDHQAFLGDRIEDIAAEKAGISKPGVPLMTLHYRALLASRVGQAAALAGAKWLPQGGAWDASVSGQHLHYRDEQGRLDLPLPRLPGAHQTINAGLAIAMLRHQSALAVPTSALRAAMGWADWPARLQRLDGALAARLPAGSELWLDGLHNPAAARAIAEFFPTSSTGGRPFHLILGLLENKDPVGVLKPFVGRADSVHTVVVPGHAHHTPAVLARLADKVGMAARPADSVSDALARIAQEAKPGLPPIVLIGGSLYLAGQVLVEDGSIPD
jgi:dihydrofolate synthase/folylpolyglutamate synthase